MKKDGTGTSIFLIVLVLFISARITGYGVSAPLDSPQLSSAQIAIIECKHQCDVNTKQCLAQGIDESTCMLSYNACYKQCDETGKPTAPVSQSQPITLITPQPKLKPQLDYGDAPDPTFPSLKLSNGARHINTEHEWLGYGVTKESESKQVDIDNKDDGVDIFDIWSLQPCTKTILPVVVSVKSRNNPIHVYGNKKLLYLNMLFDWDMNEKWEGAISCGLPAPEHAVVNYPIDVSNWPQDVTTKIVNIPLKTGPITSNIWVRATLTYNQQVNFPWDGRGKFSFGETEDYGSMGHLEHLHGP